MGYVLAGEEDIIVLDGGTVQEAEQLENLILKLGGRVKSWFLTHPHFDHVEGAAEVWRRGNICVENICFRFPPLSYVERLEARDGRRCVVPLVLESAYASGARIVTPTKGTLMSAGHFKVTPLTDGAPCGEDLNCSSVVYRVQTQGAPILFLGDLGIAGEKSLLREFPNELCCPIVQMAHHGQRGVSEEFYKFVSPKICLWPTPLWLWNNDQGLGFNTGPYRTVITRSWIEKLESENLNSFDRIAILE